MTEWTNAELIAEARDVLSRPIRADYESEEARGVIQRLADALEAAEADPDAAAYRAGRMQGRLADAERRADTAREEVGYEKRMREFVSGERDRFIGLKRAAEQERDQLAAVIEKALAVANDSAQGDSFLPTIVALESAPADVLRELKADVWEEGSETGFTHGMSYQAGNNSAMNYRNPYRKEQS